MKTKDWFLIACIFLMSLVIDQMTKLHFLSSQEFSIGLIHFVLVKNQGAMLGLFSSLPGFVRIVAFSTFGFFVLSLMTFIQYIIPRRYLPLRMGLILFSVGILGNIIDRTLYGYVIDFMAIKIDHWMSPVWNIADIFQWVGIVLILIGFIKNHESLIPTENDRKNLFINKNFQIKYAAIFITTGLMITLCCLAFSYTYLKVTLTELLPNNVIDTARYTQAFFYAFMILFLVFFIILLVIAKFISHRIAGPLYAFDRHINEILNDSSRNEQLRLRVSDEFKNLEDLAEKIRLKVDELKKNNS